jgi:hypothetical protein
VLDVGGAGEFALLAGVGGDGELDGIEEHEGSFWGF